MDIEDSGRQKRFVPTRREIRADVGVGSVVNPKHEGLTNKRTDDERLADVTAAEIQGEEKTPEQIRAEKEARQAQAEQEVVQAKVEEAKQVEEIRDKVQSQPRSRSSSSSWLGNLGGDEGRI